MNRTTALRSASAYNGPAWRDIPPWLEVLAVQLPGRERRKAEACPRTAQEAAALVVSGLARFFAPGSVPTVFFAHSMGTWVAFECIRELRRRSLQPPSLLIVSNLAAPQTAPDVRPWRRNATLSESEFKQECRAWGVNALVLKDSMWREFHQPFRRDFTIFDEYAYAEEPPLEGTAIVAFLSAGDPKITRALVAPWADQSVRHCAPPLGPSICAAKDDIL